MAQIIIYGNPDLGNVAVCHPNLDCGLTIEEIAAKDVPDGTEYWIIDDSELPAACDDECFNAWRVNNGKVTVDQAEADAIKAKNAEPSKDEIIASLMARVEALENK